MKEVFRPNKLQDENRLLSSIRATEISMKKATMGSPQWLLSTFFQVATRQVDDRTIQLLLA